MAAESGILSHLFQGVNLMADDKMDKDLERQYRKNLMVVASIVLIYSIAGGEMGDGITMLGANLKFNRPDWLEWAMMAVMCFFWWRHWQISSEIRKVHHMEASKGTLIPDKAIRHLVANGVCSMSFWYSDEPWLAARASSEFFDEYGPPETYFLLWSKPFEFWVAHAEYYDNHCNEPMRGKMVRIDAIRLRFLIFIALLKSYISCAIKKPEFGDGLLPGFISFAALCAWILNKFFYHSDAGRALWMQIFQLT